MFSASLFEACGKNPPAYAEGKAEAFSILCRIFMRPQHTVVEWKDGYIERFYVAISDGLKSDTQSLTSLLLHFPILLATPLPGIRMLIPELVFACQRVLPSLPTTPYFSRLPPEELRRAALRVLGSIIGSINLYGGVSIEPLLWENSGGKEGFVTELVREVYAENEKSSTLISVTPIRYSLCSSN